MADPIPTSPVPAATTQDAVDWTPGVAKQAMRTGVMLFVLALLVFGGTFAAALAYLALD